MSKTIQGMEAFKILQSLPIGTPLKISPSAGRPMVQSIYLGEKVIQGQQAFIMHDGTPFGWALSKRYIIDGVAGKQPSFIFDDNDPVELTKLLNI